MNCCCCASQVDLKKVEYFIQRVGECEDQIFQKRARLLRRQKERRERDKQGGGRGGGGRGRCITQRTPHGWLCDPACFPSLKLKRVNAT